jgi:hypothetical protein
VLEHVGRDLGAAAAAQVIQPRQLLIGRRGAEVNMARVQVVRGKDLGPDGFRDAKLGAEGAGAVVEFADAELRGRAGTFRDAGQVDLTDPEGGEVEVRPHLGDEADPAADERGGAGGHRVTRASRGRPADDPGVNYRDAHVPDDDQVLYFRIPHFALPCRPLADPHKRNIPGQ